MTTYKEGSPQALRQAAFDKAVDTICEVYQIDEGELHRRLLPLNKRLEDAGYEEREIVQANGIRLDNVFVKCIREEGRK